MTIKSLKPGSKKAYPQRQPMSKEEVIKVIQECAAQLGHPPSYVELIKLDKLRINAIKKNFGSYGRALWACGLEGTGPGYTTRLRRLFEDWAGVVRTYGKIPTVGEYNMRGAFSVRPFLRHYKRWCHVPAGLLDYCRKEGLESQWRDVVDAIVAHLEDPTGQNKTFMPDRPLNLLERPLYGDPLTLTPLTYAPTSEGGVIFLFGTMARELGYAVSRIQPGFPDCEAMREVRPAQWQHVRIEFEFESRNFLVHDHPVAGCDLIVCWNHNWQNCPVEVLELSKVVMAAANADRA